MVRKLVDKISAGARGLPLVVAGNARSYLALSPRNETGVTFSLARSVILSILITSKQISVITVKF